jgi:hypothetical protein
MNKSEHPTIPAISPSPTPTTKPTILFPAGGETLSKGKEYTLKWTGTTSAKTQIFLINTSLESQGVSVSSVDRIYNIENTGSYTYTIPTTIPDGKYKLQIGQLTSNDFQIIPNQQEITSCRTTDIQGQLSLEPAAGNIYGTITITNTSTRTCKIIANNNITATYNTNKVKNIVIDYKTKPTLDTYYLLPQNTLYSQIHYPNGPQCSTPIQSTPVIFSYKISSASAVTLRTPQGRITQSVTTCTDPTEKTTIDLWSLSQKPITP